MLTSEQKKERVKLFLEKIGDYINKTIDLKKDKDLYPFEMIAIVVGSAQMAGNTWSRTYEKEHPNFELYEALDAIEQYVLGELDKGPVKLDETKESETPVMKKPGTFSGKPGSDISN